MIGRALAVVRIPHSNLDNIRVGVESLFFVIPLYCVICGLSLWFVLYFSLELNGCRKRIRQYFRIFNGVRWSNILVGTVGLGPVHSGIKDV